MNKLISAFVNRPSPVLLVLAVLLVAGTSAYIAIPKESEPDVSIPTLYINMVHEGISPEDAERLLIRPMETELRTIEGLREMRATAAEGSAVLILEFDAGFDADKALTDVREKVDIAKAELPADTEEPWVQEINIALFPVLVVQLHGDVPERTLVGIARNLRDTLEGLPGVLSADIAGDREELLEVIVDPVRLESYNLSYEELFNYVSRNNRLVAAGALDTGRGRFAIKVPGVFEDLDSLLTLPIKTDGQRTVTFADVAEVRRTFKDPTGYARLDGKPAIALEISKRIGANIVEVVDSVRRTVEQERARWPENLQVTFTQDNSEDVRTMLQDLQNNVLTAVLLVMVVTLAALGLRSSALVGISVPGSFLAGILIIWLSGWSINIVVLFSLIMAVGMLVDGATIVVELADRNLAAGYSRKEAYIRRGAANVGARDLLDRNDARRVRAAAVLAGADRRIHDLPADHAPDHARGLARDGALVRSHRGSAARQAAAGRSGNDFRRAHRRRRASELGAPGRRDASVHPASAARARSPGPRRAPRDSPVGRFLGIYSWIGRGVEFFPEIEPKSSEREHTRARRSLGAGAR